MRFSYLHSALRQLRLKKINVFIYRIHTSSYKVMSPLEYTIQKREISSIKTMYVIRDHHELVHRSTLFENIYLLRLINKSGPVIGDCYTHTKYRGLSIYPKVINYIAKSCLYEKGLKEVFVIVDITNTNSINGLNKAGFTKYVHIEAHRWLGLYFNKTITYF